uniref:Uncharacterized protein n=1 Tax=Arundo donax TaxID=35708 RepID=A0A0A9FZB6_ARUDO
MLNFRYADEKRISLFEKRSSCLDYGLGCGVVHHADLIST